VSLEYATGEFMKMEFIGKNAIVLKMVAIQLLYHHQKLLLSS
jgi:hypothetical protein